MVNKWGLRLRIFLFFALVAATTALTASFGVYVGHSRLATAGPEGALMTAALVATFLQIGIIVWVWYLFDENVAKPILALANTLRVRAHAEEAEPEESMDAETRAKYLGDLAPAASAIVDGLAKTRMAINSVVAKHTHQLTLDNARLARLVRDAPLGLVVCNAAHRIVLYNREAEALLGNACPLGLDRPLSDVLAAEPIAAAFERLCEGATDGDMMEVLCTAIDDDTSICAKVYLIEDQAADDTPRAYVLALEPAPKRATHSANGAAEPAIDFANHAHPAIVSRPQPEDRIDFDFALLTNAVTDAQERADLASLPYVVFDTETTGLRPDKDDEIVQIAAVRVVNGRVVDGDRFDLLVNPGRLIPAASIKIHGITPDMVDDADDIEAAGRRFHRFCGDAVLVAHNAPFDLAFFRKHEARIGARFDNPVLDTILLSAVLFGRKAEHSLDALVARFGIEIPAEDRHTAIGDALATARALARMLPMLRERGVVTLHDAFEASKPLRNMLTAQPSGAKLPVTTPPRVEVSEQAR